MQMQVSQGGALGPIELIPVDHITRDTATLVVTLVADTMAAYRSLRDENGQLSRRQRI
jgi:hypothetical protein